MQCFKISLITVTRNAQKTIGRCIQSVITQSYNNIEYIIIDGASTDDTLQIINQYKQHIDLFISEYDEGIYDAMNKGIKLATGNIIGILNSDDFFAYKETLADIATTFINENTDVLYGNLNYINLNGGIVRKWRSGAYTHGMFNKGWMPPHPTFYCKRLLFERWGKYDLQYGTAADYELMLRFIHLNKASTYYLNKTMVNMVTGGESNKSYFNRIKAWRNDYKAMKKNGIKFALLCICFKPISKLFQYI